jgi:hypothetical protein
MSRYAEILLDHEGGSDRKRKERGERKTAQRDHNFSVHAGENLKARHKVPA